MRVRPAFTLAELLVVIAIIGILLGLLLPAVQAARISAQKVLLTNRLKQLGIAIHNYENCFKQFPPSKMGTDTDHVTRRHSLMTFLLPYMEQQQVYDRFDFRYHWFQPPNKQASQVRLPELLSPLAPSSRFCDGSDYYPSDFAACERIRLQQPIRSLIDRGVITERRDWYSVLLPAWKGVSTTARITDGLSNSMMLFECSGRPFKFERGRIRGDPNVSPLEPMSGTDWADYDSQLWIDTVCGPDSSLFFNCNNYNELFSFNPNGAAFLFGDGAVHFLAETIDPEVFVSLFTACAGEIVSPDF